jgi:hypothetical protein
MERAIAGIEAPRNGLSSIREQLTNIVILQKPGAKTLGLFAFSRKFDKIEIISTSLPSCQTLDTEWFQVEAAMNLSLFFYR